MPPEQPQWITLLEHPSMATTASCIQNKIAIPTTMNLTKVNVSTVGFIIQSEFQLLILAERFMYSALTSQRPWKIKTYISPLYFL